MKLCTRIIYKVFVAVVAVAILAACGEGTVYDDYVHTPIDGWENDDTLSFSVPRMESNGHYGCIIGVRTTDAFPFTAISIAVEQTIEPGHRVHTDTLNCRLADSRGNLLGDGVSYFQYEYPLPDVFLRRGDSLHVAVHHIMKREILPGISDVGLKILHK